jgi:hypothetical protein
MGLGGTQLKMRDIAALAYAVGWHDVRLVCDATAICNAESSRYTQANNLDAHGQPTNSDGTVDYGLWQINSIHMNETIGGVVVTIDACYDPHKNALIAHGLYRRSGGFNAWAAFSSGAYLKSVPGALNGIRYWQLLEHDLPLPS